MADLLNINEELGPLYTVQVVQYEQALSTEFGFTETQAPFKVFTHNPPAQKLSLTMSSPITGEVLPSVVVGPDLVPQQNLSVLIGTVLPGDNIPSFGLVFDQAIRQTFSLVVAPIKSISSDNGSISSFETVSKNLTAIPSNLVYSGSQITSQVYDNGVIKTFGYGGPSGMVNTITLSGVVPGGIALVKTLLYTGTKPTRVEYS